MTSQTSAPVVLDAASYPIVWPGDWERHDAVWLSWSSVDYSRQLSFHTAFFAIVCALHSRVKLCCLCDGPDDEASIRAQAKQAAVPSDAIDIVHIGRTGPWDA